jgi:hypothetical protein
VRNWAAGVILIPSFHTQCTSKENYDNLIATVWIGDERCHMVIDTKASATNVRLDIIAGLRERKLNQPYILRMASGENPHVLREALVKVSIAEITDRYAAGQSPGGGEPPSGT